MNFSLQIIPFEEKIKQNPISITMDSSKFNEQSEYALGKISRAKKSIKLDRREKVSWNLTECNRYLKFLIQNQHFLELQKKDKRHLKLNVKMSKVIKSRDSAQCHSHHQKMMLKYGSVSKIINSLKYLGQATLPKIKAAQKIPEQNTQIKQFELQEFAIDFNFSLSSLFYREKQEELMEIDLLQPEGYQYYLSDSLDDCFI